MKCIICSKLLTGLQRKYCSNKCKHQNTNNKFNNYQAQQKRGLDRKIKLIKMLGGKCNNCDYSKNIAALCFHHLHDMSFRLDMRSLSNRSWKKCLAEAKKCKLLCHNCHMETHYPDLEDAY